VTAICYGTTGIAAMYLISKYTLPIVNTRIYKWISPNSFGIYLFHAMIIYMLEFAFRSTPIHPILLSAIVFAASTVLSVILTEIVRKAHLGIILGEKTK
jgi:surface polysaccharide O-acyltransferase-like enzyme